MNAKKIAQLAEEPLAKVHLILLKMIQNAYSGEKAAALAYWGHAHSFFVSDINEKQELLEIMKEELHHRAELLSLLQSFDKKPSLIKEFVMTSIGLTIAFLCLFGTWFIPMYGAGVLESKNINEYEVLARLAYLDGQQELVPLFLSFAEKEWDHEFYFRQKVLKHQLSKYVSLWPGPPERHLFQQTFNEFKKTHTPISN